MSQEVRIPSVGESITVGTIATWHKQDGDFVQQGDVLLTLETDKISTEVPAEATGTLSIQVPEGEEVDIGAVVGSIAPGEAPSASNAEPSEEPAQPKPKPKPEPEPETESATPSPSPRSEEHDPSKFVAFPSSETGASDPPAPSTPPVTASPSPKPEGDRVTRSKMSPLRRKIAEHLVNAQQTAAMLTTFNECDMSAVMKLRKELQESFVAKYGVKLGFMSFFIKSVVEALKTVPQVNGRIDGQEIVQNHFYDIGVAIGTDRGLIVPVLRNCDQKNFAAIENEIIDYANRAREGKIELSDLEGGVFTISNGGIYGSLLSTPILNFPQSAILGMHAIVERPVARDGEVVIRPVMNLALSYDHRLIDGKEAVTFLVRVKECIEQPARLMIEA